ncbi:MAG: DUF1549 domain-containing protein [Planctomycetes bacterium]|nr:DUF1549 domain-containing protein [Planctomycetota bacterium]
MRNRLLLLLAAVAWPGAVRAAEPPDPAKLAARIDDRLGAEWKRAGAKPAPLVDDATFLRRASLDLVGRVPTAAEVRAFLADTAADKRARLVAQLIDSGGHTRHMATFWRRTWVPQADTPEFARLADDFEAWVAARVQENVPYDRVVRELLTQPGAAGRRGAVSPVGFFAASESKPENLAANATRSFLGVNLDCAQCHNHPFARWTRDQFWQTAAFFAAPKTGDGGKAMPPELTIPNTKRALSPELLDGTAVKWPEVLASDTGRKLLTDWLTAKDNPYFARNAVNRLWAHVYGTALVEPLDDLSGDGGNTGYHAELLKELADAFAASGFDLKYITRALVLTKAYQLSAVTPDATDPRLFARMPIRGLTGEQLYDSLRTAAGLPPERADTGRGLGLEGRRRFAAQFHVERPVMAERSITQALSMMNGRLITDLTDPAKNPTLGGVASAPFLDTKGKVETLFLAALGRKPTAKEAKTMVEYVEGVTESDRDRALGDVFWALVNSSEFNTNH